MKLLLKAIVHRNGIKFEGIKYYHPALHRWIGQLVLFQTKKRRLYVKVYTLEGEYICKAKADYFMEIPVTQQKCASCPYYPQAGNKLQRL